MEPDLSKEDSCCHDTSKCSKRRGRRGLLEPAVLISLATQEAHGYELASTVERLTGACPDSAAVYRTLRSLEEADAVESCWVPADSGPARREYRITERGRVLLGEWAQELTERAAVCSSLAEAAASSTGRPTLNASNAT